MKLLQDIESPQERQRRWGAITAPAILCLGREPELPLRHKRGAFAGVFTRLVARSEAAGLRLCTQDLVCAARISYAIYPDEPSKPLRCITEFWSRSGQVGVTDLTDEQCFRLLWERLVLHDDS